MSTVLVTGTTGMVGNVLARKLLEKGYKVKCLVRDIEKAKKLLPEHENLELCKGDVTDIKSIEEALTDDISGVFHVAGFPEQWTQDISIFYKINTEGTKNMVDMCHKKKIKRFVYTSTIDVMRAEPKKEFDESWGVDKNPKDTDYQRSKQLADNYVQKMIDEEKFPAIVLHPSALYGPSPTATAGLNDFFQRLLTGQIPILLPGAIPAVYSDDCAEGHVRAYESAEIGERFILAGENYTLEEIARQVIAMTNSTMKVPSVLPIPLAKTVSVVGTAVSNYITHTRPLIPPGQYTFLTSFKMPVGKKAQEKLGLKMTPFSVGLRNTLLYLKEKGQLPNIEIKELDQAQEKKEESKGNEKKEESKGNEEQEVKQEPSKEENDEVKKEGEQE